MKSHDDIFNLLRSKDSEAVQASKKLLILQPGAIGDCILTLPLAQFMKDMLDLGGIDIAGHTDYTSVLQDRTCIDGIRSIDSLDLHRLFVKADSFDLPDGDPLIYAFEGYSWVVTFLGEEGSDFEQNLIYTANCSQGAEIVTMQFSPPKEQNLHLTEFYIRQFIAQTGLPKEHKDYRRDRILIKAMESDREQGRSLLESLGVDFSKKALVIHPGSGSLKKCWHLDNFLSIGRQASSKDMEVVFLLGPAETERLEPRMSQICEIGSCLSDLSLNEVIGILSCADYYIGNDSGITHLAGGLGVKTIVVFGPTNPKIYSPVGPSVKVLIDKSKRFSKKGASGLQKDIIDMLTT